MLHITLLVLKILLFTVLILLGIVLLLLAMVLFVPVKYKIYVDKHEDVACKAKASWMGLVIYFLASYDKGGFYYKLKSFGGTISDNQAVDENDPKKKKKEKKNKEKKPKEKKEKKKKEISSEDVVSEQKDSASDINLLNSEANEKDIPQSNSSETQSAGEPVISEEEKRVIDDKDLTSSNGKLKILVGKFVDGVIIKTFKGIRKIWKKITDMTDFVGRIKNFLKDDNTKEAWKVIKHNLKKLLKHMNPKTIKGEITYGAGEPAKTGEMLGCMSLAFPLYYNKINVIPDFSQNILEGEVYIKGRIRIYNLILYTLKVVLNKKVKKAIEQGKKLKGGNK